MSAVPSRTPAIGDDVVSLREWTPEDADWYADTVVGDDLIQRFTAESPTVTADDVRSAIRTLLSRPAGSAGFLIADAASHERLGNIALTYEGGVGDVSYWLAPSARGRGAATRALRLFTEWAHTALDLPEVRLWAHAGNAGSRAVAERAGYLRRPEGDRRRQVKGQDWPTVAYVHHRTGPARG